MLFLEDPLSNHILKTLYLLEVLDALVDGLDVVGEGAGAGCAVRAMPARLVALLQTWFDLLGGLFDLFDLSLFLGDVVRNVLLLLVGRGGGRCGAVVRLQVNVQVGPDNDE